ncbi:MAG: hypothetical protein KBE22_09480 [Candidatus Accumulibacter sp.]|nr:hypothetical protein [Accumulibacter sp.]
MSRVQWTRERFGLPAQAAILQRANEITRGTSERDRQLYSYAQKTQIEVKPLIQELQEREAHLLKLEAKLDLTAPGQFSSESDITQT